MKSKMIMAIVLAVFLAAGVFGVIKKQTYTDIVSEPNYMDKLHVAVLREPLAVSTCNALSVELLNVPIILKVKCVDEMEYVYQAGQQKVRVEEVFQGSERVKGEEIYIYSERWTVLVWSAPNSAERGFVNLMEPGKEYLVFLTGKTVKVPGESAPGYEVFDDFLILPIFLYGEREYTPMDLAEDVKNTYVPYTKVKENEIFADNTVGYEAWLELKEILFEKYAAF